MAPLQQITFLLHPFSWTPNTEQAFAWLKDALHNGFNPDSSWPVPLVCGGISNPRWRPSKMVLLFSYSLTTMAHGHQIQQCSMYSTARHYYIMEIMHQPTCMKNYRKCFAISACWRDQALSPGHCLDLVPRRGVNRSGVREKGSVTRGRVSILG